MTQTFPGLRRFETTVLKDKSGSAPAQVPAAASVTIYRQGVVARATISIPPQSAPEEGLPVADVGSARIGDTLQVFRNGAFQPGSLSVIGIISSTVLDRR